MVAAIIYFVSPSTSSDSIPVIGHIDDVVFASLLSR
jgi:uncharacterized membrane protein YkvA (DUF1232 family)